MLRKILIYRQTIVVEAQNKGVEFMFKAGNEDKVYSGCAISAVLDKGRNCFAGDEIVSSISSMQERSNGLGGGFAAYGIYPEQQDEFAFHVFFTDDQARQECSRYLAEHFAISREEQIPTRQQQVRLNNPPLIWRYFLKPYPEKLNLSGYTEKEFVAQQTVKINKELQGTYIVSCGQNMGVFKGLGYPAEIAEFYQLENYQGYLWTAHGRFPTNTSGWWAGAHPFALLNWSVVHNGEISSFGANKRYIEMFGYECTMKTDTEVITYLIDLLVRRHGLSLSTAARALAAPFWQEIGHLPPGKQKLLKNIRIIYGNALLNGPFSIIMAHKEGLFILNDRIKLRPIVVAESGSKMYAASEESAIRAICPEPQHIATPRGGEPVLGLVEGRDIPCKMAQ